MSNPPVPLVATIDINTVEAAHALLRPLLDTSGDIVLDGSAVERMTTPGVQLLLSLAKTLGKEQRSLRLHHPSSVLEEAFTDLGLHSILHAWSA